VAVPPVARFRPVLRGKMFGLCFPDDPMTEGHINRLKTLKRQMYGRAKFDLLRQRLLSPHDFHRE